MKMTSKITLNQELELRVIELEVSKYNREQLIHTILMQKKCEIFLKDLIKTLMIGELEAMHDAENDMHYSDEVEGREIDGQEFPDW